MNNMNHTMNNTVLIITKKKKKMNTKKTTMNMTHHFNRALIFFVLFGASIMLNGNMNMNMNMNIQLFVRGEEIITEVRRKKNEKALFITCTYFAYYMKTCIFLPAFLPVLLPSSDTYKMNIKNIRQYNTYIQSHRFSVFVFVFLCFIFPCVFPEYPAGSSSSSSSTTTVLQKRDGASW